LDRARDRLDGCAGGEPTVQAKVEHHLVVARAARVQGGARRRQLREAALDRRMDVLIGGRELELAPIQLALDPAQPTLDGCELRRLDDAGGRQAPRMRDAAREIERIELEVDLQRRREALELRQQPTGEPPAPELGALARYGASLFTSPSRLPSSRSWSRPWTCEAVRTPSPHSLMKPAAADWSNASPLP